jgi:mannose-1-phosphate guanylyltransferase
MIIPVILCGGIGSRLWPLSREDNPKQFLKLNNNYSLFQETILRVRDDTIFLDPIIICGEQYKFKVASELEEINVKPYAILLEPCQRNTAPAIAAAAIFIREQFKDSKTMLVLPADHSIKNNSLLVEAVKACQKFSNKGIITFGIAPTHAATGYGYIQIGDKLDEEVYWVKNFTEKPMSLKAEEFIRSKDYFWNSGMFLMNDRLYIKELKETNPDMLTELELSIKKSKRSFDFIELNKEHFSKLENISIDVAILEKTKNVLLCPIKLDWLDLGNWKSVYTDMKKDTNENVIVGNKVYSNECKNSLFYSDCTRYLIANKLENICVINTEDAILITNKDIVF